MGRPKVIRPELECPGCNRRFIPKKKHQEYCARGCASMIPAIERFWTKVDRRGPDECWPWIAARHKYGHGAFRYRDQNGIRQQYAHRLSWIMANGPVPEGKWICHHCDNPPCVNPAHLYPGSMADNCRDRDIRGRSGNATLDIPTVQSIRKLIGRVSDEEIANQFKSKTSIIAAIRRGDHYSWVPA